MLVPPRQGKLLKPLDIFQFVREIYGKSRNFSCPKSNLNLIDLNINTTHPFYDLAFDAIESAHSGNLNLNDPDDLDEVKERLKKSEKTLYKMLVGSLITRVNFLEKISSG